MGDGIGARVGARLDRAIQEVRAREHGRRHELDAFVEAAGALAALVVERQQPIEVGLRHGPAVRAAREVRRDLDGALALALRDLGLADEQIAATRRLREARRVERPHHVDAAGDARHARGAAEREVAHAVGGVLVVGGARALDERDHDLVRTGRDLERDIGEALHELRARRRAAGIDEREILFAADVGAVLLVAVHEHDERVPGFDGTRVQAGAEVAGDRDAVLAVGRERVREFHAAARAERHARNVRALAAAGRREIGRRDFRLRLADREVRDGARGVHVLLDERRRRRERRRDVREAVNLDFRGQVFLGIDLDVEQRLHGMRVLGAREALRRDVAGLLRRVLVDRALEARDEPVDLFGCRLRLAGRRHQPAAQLDDRGLELLGVLRHLVEAEALERDLPGELGGVVALRAVAVEHGEALALAPLLELGYEEDGRAGCH